MRSSTKRPTWWQRSCTWQSIPWFGTQLSWAGDCEGHVGKVLTPRGAIEYDMLMLVGWSLLCVGSRARISAGITRSERPSAWHFGDSSRFELHILPYI